MVRKIKLPDQSKNLKFLKDNVIHFKKHDTFVPYDVISQIFSFLPFFPYQMAYQRISRTIQALCIQDIFPKLTTLRLMPQPNTNLPFKAFGHISHFTQNNELRAAFYTSVCKLVQNTTRLQILVPRIMNFECNLLQPFCTSLPRLTDIDLVFVSGKSMEAINISPRIKTLSIYNHSLNDYPYLRNTSDNLSITYHYCIKRNGESIQKGDPQSVVTYFETFKSML